MNAKAVHKCELLGRLTEMMRYSMQGHMRRVELISRHIFPSKSSTIRDIVYGQCPNEVDPAFTPRFKIYILLTFLIAIV